MRRDQPGQGGGEPAGQQPGGQRGHGHGQGGGQQQPPGHHRQEAETEAADLVDQQHPADTEALPLAGDDRPGDAVAGAGDDPALGEGGGQVDRTKLESWTPTMTREQRDSWNRVWTFLDWNLDPFQGAPPK